MISNLSFPFPWLGIKPSPLALELCLKAGEEGVVKHFGAFFLEVVVEMQLKSRMSNRRGRWRFHRSNPLGNTPLLARGFIPQLHEPNCL